MPTQTTKKPIKKTATKSRSKPAKKVSKAVSAAVRNPKNYAIRADVPADEVRESLKKGKEVRDRIMSQYQHTDPFQKGMTYGDMRTISESMFEDVILCYGTEEAVDKAIALRSVAKLQRVPFMGAVAQVSEDSEASESVLTIDVPVGLMVNHMIINKFNSKKKARAVAGKEGCLLLCYVGSQSVMSFKMLMRTKRLPDGNKLSASPKLRLSYSVRPEDRVQLGNISIPLQSFDVVN